MTCKECIHYEACEWFGHIYVEEMADDCLRFKPKSRFIELPCKVGQTVWVVSRYYKCDWHIHECLVDSITLYEKHTFLSLCEKGKRQNVFGEEKSQIGKTVFLTKEEAEKTLAERNKK